MADDPAFTVLLLNFPSFVALSETADVRALNSIFRLAISGTPDSGPSGFASGDPTFEIVFVLGVLAATPGSTGSLK